MTRLLPALAALLFLASPALAQLPFDMSPERDMLPPVIEEAPAPAAPEAPAAPTLARYLLPGTGVRLQGEMDRRAFDFYLTEAQAAAPATLELSILNAILVSPEDSRLALAINGVDLLSQPVEFSAQPTALVLEVPQGVLRPGRNRLDFDATQRHRTDCSVASTYELWSDIYATGTLLRLSGDHLGRVGSLADLPAVGLNPAGMTGLDLLVPQWEDARATEAALRLVQDLALSTRAPAVDVMMIDDLDARPETGALTVVLATADRLPAEVAALAGEARAGPLVGFASAAALPNTLVVSGPDWTAVGEAVRSIALSRPALEENNLAGQRVDLADAVPLVTGATEIALADLGVETVEFNGRRYHSALRFALPPDFYASMYAQAELVIDAAYSPAVRPGSQLEVYINGQIAAGMPVLRTEGGTFRDTRLRIPMTNFQPGINQMSIETVLLTAEDAACPPGIAGRAASRFLFSSDSRLTFPDFARIGQYPDLRALAGSAYPYAGNEVQVTVAGGREALEAAMTLLTRLALEAGEAIAARVVPAESLDPAAPALVVAPMASLSPALLGRGGIVELDAAGRLPVVGSGEDALERWRSVSGGREANPFERFRDWAADRLNLRPENFWLFRRDDGAYLPQSPDAVILSQARQDEGGVWTMLTIPQAQALLPATRTLVTPAVWSQVAGRVSAVAAGGAEVLVLQPASSDLVETQPFSLTNFRLVLTNFVSTNVLGYAVLVAVLAVLLSLATTVLLSGAGRRT